MPTGVPAVSGVPCSVRGALRCRGLPAVLGGALWCRGLLAVLGAPCSVGGRPEVSGGTLQCQGLPAVSGAPCSVRGSLRCRGLPAALGALYIVGGSPECQRLHAALGGSLHCGGLPRVSGAPCSVGGSLWSWGAPCGVGGSLKRGGPGQTARAGGPGGHQPCCPLTWCPSALSAVNLDHFQILRAIGKGSFGKVRPRAGWTGHVWAGPAAWVCWRVCLPRGRPTMLEASGGLSMSPPPLGSPGPGLWALVAQLTLSQAGGADGVPLGSSGAETLRSTHPSGEPLSIAVDRAAQGPGGKCLRSHSVGGWPPASGVAVTLEPRGQACAEPSLQAGRGRTQVAATMPCPTQAARARCPLSLGRIQAPDCSLILPGDQG